MSHDFTCHLTCVCACIVMQCATHLHHAHMGMWEGVGCTAIPSLPPDSSQGAGLCIHASPEGPLPPSPLCGHCSHGCHPHLLHHLRHSHPPPPRPLQPHGGQGEGRTRPGESREAGTGNWGERRRPYLSGLSQVFKTIKLFLAKLEKFSEDPVAAAQQEKEEGQSGLLPIPPS